MMAKQDSSEPDPKPEQQGAGPTRAILLALAVVVIAAVAMLAFRTHFGGGERTAGVPAAPAIGGPFTLTDHTGRTVTDADFRGRFMLIYFGYTYCPDICPTSLSRNSDALDILGDAAKDVVPILISVDHERDTPEYLNEYRDFFHPRLVAMVGTEEQVAAVAKVYRVYFAKVQEEGADADDYLMDHTAITYLMGPDGTFITHFGHQVGAEAMAERLRGYL